MPVPLRGARAPQGSPWFPRLSATVCEVFCTISLFVSCFLFQIEKKEEIPGESLDWWSKFFASIGDEEKCGEFLNLGYKKMTVISLASFRQRGIILTVQYKYIFSNPLSFRPCYRPELGDKPNVNLWSQDIFRTGKSVP